MGTVYGKNPPDGTGILASINEGNAPIVLDYICNVLKYNGTIVDCGTGVGWLVKLGNGNVIGIDGHMEPIAKKVCEQNILFGNLLDTDFMKNVGKVGLCTSFEVIEHIHEDDILSLFKNIQLISDKLLCSIHIGTIWCAGHILIKSEEWWNNFFEKNKIEFKKITDLSELNWDNSIFYLLDLNQLNNSE